MTAPNWVICPFRDRWDLTRDALADALAQTLPDLRVLLIDQGSSEETRQAYLQELADPRVSLWRHQPPMLSLSATWNRALGMVWEGGGLSALVINNDLRFVPVTYKYLRSVQENTGAYFVTATGVTQEQYDTFCAEGHVDISDGMPPYPLPGPDFSCYLITKAGHEAYPFDENYVPAYVEDCDMHRRYMLRGDGGRIFGTGLPYYHVGSGTLKGLDADKRMKLEAQISAGSRQYHLKKWGGTGANEETYTVPFEPTSARADVSNPELFERVRNGQPAL